MNTYINKIVLASLVATLGVVAPTSAEAHGGGGWVLPAILGGALLYDITRPNYYYPPQTVYVQQPIYVQQPVYEPQTVYVQQPTYVPPTYSQSYGYETQSTQPLPQAAQAAPPVWYYCESSKGYYPYANACPEGWRVVPSVPPAAMEQPQGSPPPPPR
jgi:hypothetical protein